MRVLLAILVASLSLASVAAETPIPMPKVYGPSEFTERMQAAWGTMDRIDQMQVSTYIRSVAWDNNPPKIEDLAIFTMMIDGHNRQGDVKFFRPRCYPCAQDAVLDASVLAHEASHIQQGVLYGTVKASEAECIPRATAAEFLRRKSALSPDDQALKGIAELFSKYAAATCAAEQKR